MKTFSLIATLAVLILSFAKPAAAIQSGMCLEAGNGSGIWQVQAIEGGDLIGARFGTNDSQTMDATTQYARVDCPSV